MRYIDLEVIDIRSMIVGGYIHNYARFYEKSTSQMSVNKGRITKT